MGFNLRMGFFRNNNIRQVTMKALFVFIASGAIWGCNPPLRVEPHGRPKRIISLSPSITETLFAIGAGDRVAGDTIFCNWPRAANYLPKAGEFSRVYFEKILWLEADLVIANRDSPSETVGDSLREYGIPTLVVGAYTVDETLDMIRRIGQAVGEEAGAERIAGDMEKRAEAIEGEVKGAKRVKTILIFGHDPLILAGPGTFADDLIKLAGGVNLAGDSRIKYPTYSIERIVLDGPEVIIEASHSAAYSSPDSAEIREFWKQWPDIPAVRAGRVLVVDADLVTRPGPRIVDGLDVIARALHPERMR